NQTTSFTASGGAAGATYSWSGPAGYVNSNAANSGTLTVAGTYIVLITNTTGCTSTCSRTLSVNPLPGCSIIGTNQICTGGSTSFTASGGAAGATYSWSGPAGYVNSNAANSGTLTLAGTYTVLITNTTGCTSSCSRILTVVANPIVFITVGSQFCVNDPNAPNAGSVTQQGSQLGVSYQLYDDGANPIGAPRAGTGLPGQETMPANWIIWTGLPAGTYAAQATGSGPTACVTLEPPAAVIENPIPNVTVRDTTVCLNTGCFNLSLLNGSPAGGVWSGTGVSSNGLQFCTTGLQAGIYSITYTVSDLNQCTSSATARITVNNCSNAICTYTQGYYGNAGGTSCDGTTGGYSTDGLIALSLGNWGGTLRIGLPGRSVVITNNSTDRACVIDKMPGGGGSKELSVVADINICNLPLSYLKNGKINNTLLSQTLALALNVGITSPSTLGNFVLQAGVLATAKPLGGCGSNVPKTRVCNYNPLAPYNLVSVTNEYTYRTFSAALINAIVGPKTIQGLLNLANSALANADGVVGSENGISLSEIAGAAGAINEVFDECRIFVGWDVAPCPPTQVPPVTQSFRTSENVSVVKPIVEEVAKLSVTAFPNPYTDQVKFVIASPASGQGTLEIYNMAGQKLQTINAGHVFAGKGQVIKYDVPALNRTNLVYILRVGNQQVIGKLTNIK
ncbi:MAG: hypothetical protein ABIT81_01955, partial [Ferruginibacter sp.]